VRRRVDELVALESQCCAFLDFRVEDESGATRLTIAAPNGGEETLNELADLLSASG
jgi:hypothetical protein